ncbi:MAG: hypothetical protein GWN86_10040, partial [Desulfobacterales bacterium]|nr:hypothetical protein [Desulfobacterales bacterium]
KKRHNVDIDFTNLPLDDKETFEDIAEGRTATCFQIGSKGLQRFCKQLSISDLDSLCATSALWRPGPLRSGMTNKYTACKLGKEKPKYFHSIYKEITKDTQGQLIYQEQVMFLMHELAGIPWDKVDKVRKVISKSKGGKEWEKYQSMFVKGCKKKGTMKRGAAIKFWNRLESYASYSFNKSHAVAYGIIGYWTAYCKTHYPLEYLCAYLNYGSVEGFDPNSKVKKKNIALAEARRLKIKIKPPDINLSNKGWTIEGKSLRAGVSEITGVGQAATDAIFKGRVQCGGKFSDITQMVISVDRRRVHRGVINKLCLSGTLDALLNEDAKYWKASFEKMLAACTSPKKYEKTKEEITNEVELEYDKIKDELDRIRQECIDYQLSETAMGEHEQFYKTLCEFVKITPNSTVKDGMKKGGKTKLYCGVAANVKV